VGYNGNTEISRKIEIPLGQSITGLTAKEGKIFLLNNPAKDKRFIPEVEWPFKGTICSYLSAPLRLSNTTIGVIRLLNRRDGPFLAADAQLLMDVADSLSIAIRNVKLYEQLNRSVEDVITANRNLQKANDELTLKAKELEALKKQLGRKSHG
jgi:GAF domain-containing protein